MAPVPMPSETGDCQQQWQMDSRANNHNCSLRWGWWYVSGVYGHGREANSRSIGN
ncbi:hypothetical protein Ancab_032438, partial [Ancistrocladus abbreviatus]